jgi:hypothetical protein
MSATSAVVRKPESFAMSEATVKALAAHAGLSVLAQTPQLIALHTIIRDRKASREDFIFYSDRLIRLLVEEGQCREDGHVFFRRDDVLNDCFFFFFFFFFFPFQRLEFVAV